VLCFTSAGLVCAHLGYPHDSHDCEVVPRPPEKIVLGVMEVISEMVSRIGLRWLEDQRQQRH
jgi:hypothetical protein